MIVTTTPTVEGRRIKDYLGVITGEALIGAHIFRNIAATVRDLGGGRPTSDERELRKARETALAELRLAATELRASAVVGVNLHYESIDGPANLIMVIASGTAVVLE